jgi:hypothetical protein
MMLAQLCTGLHPRRRKAMLVMEDRKMWTRRAIAGLLTGLLLGAAPAFAFQETPQTSDNEPIAEITTPPMKLGTPDSPADPKNDHKGLKLFGYKVFPKLNFGLDVLYGEETQQSEQQPNPPTLEEDDDVSVLGKIKRLF